MRFEHCAQAVLLAQINFGCLPDRAERAERLSDWLMDKTFADSFRRCATRGQSYGRVSREVAQQRAIEALHRSDEADGY